MSAVAAGGARSGRGAVMSAVPEAARVPAGAPR